MRRAHPGRWKYRSKRGSGPRLSNSLVEPARVERGAGEGTSEVDRAQLMWDSAHFSLFCPLSTNLILSQRIMVQGNEMVTEWPACWVLSKIWLDPKYSLFP